MATPAAVVSPGVHVLAGTQRLKQGLLAPLIFAIKCRHRSGRNTVEVGGVQVPAPNEGDQGKHEITTVKSTWFDGRQGENAVMVPRSAKVDGQMAREWSKVASLVRITYVRAYNIRRFSRAPLRIGSLKPRSIAWPLEESFLNAGSHRRSRLCKSFQTVGIMVGLIFTRPIGPQC